MSTSINGLGNVLTLSAVALFAITGVLAGLREGSDIFSLVTFGVISAVGGGTIRDMILNTTVFWTTDLTYIWVAIWASMLAFVVYRHAVHAQRLLLYIDAGGLALFTIQAIDKVLGLGFAPLIALIMGIITGIGGGLVRDVLTARPTLLMRKDLYATPILLGSLVYLGLLTYYPGFPFAWLVAMAIIFGLRVAAIYWNLTMPGWLTTKSTS